MENVHLDIEDGIATLTIDRPEAMNALNSQTREELTEAVKRVDSDDDARVLVITGSGDRAFSAGQDINESREFEGDAVAEWVEEFDRLYEKILGIDVPVIARINGDAIGSALQVALLCDIRIASEEARIGMNEINIGIPCILGAWLIENVAGYDAAAKLTLTGDPISAHEGEELGLIGSVVPDDELDDTVNELATTLASKPPIAMERQKQWLRNLRFDEGDLREVSQRGQEIHTEVYASGEPEQYMSEFLDRD